MLGSPASPVRWQLGGCGMVDGVELQGGVFDALGVSSSSQGPRTEPKVAARPGLVLPPNEQALPQPGSAPATTGAVAGSDWPTDPEETKARRNAAAEAQHKEFCERAKRQAVGER